MKVIKKVIKKSKLSSKQEAAKKIKSTGKTIVKKKAQGKMPIKEATKAK